MFKIYMLAILMGVSSVCHAQIVEKPLVLEAPAGANRDALEHQDNPDQIYFPPATEPYKPVETKVAPVAAPQPFKQTPAQEKQFQNPVPQPVKQFQQPQPTQISSQPAFASVPVANNHAATGYGTGRDSIERAADNCEAELSQLWQRKANVDPSRRAQFQKCMGEAKLRCDQLKEASKAFKQADVHLNTYQNNLQQAQAAAN